MPPNELFKRYETSTEISVSLWPKRSISSFYSCFLPMGTSGNSFSLSLKRALNSKQYFAQRLDFTVTLYQINSKNFFSSLFNCCVMKKGQMNAKSELLKQRSSQTFWATNSEQRTKGLQLVGCSGISVNAISRLM